jgi:hypothetical protein
VCRQNLADRRLVVGGGAVEEQARSMVNLIWAEGHLGAH